MSLADRILARAQQKAEEILSVGNAEAMEISAESMKKTNARRKELELQCLKDAEKLILDIREKAVMAGEAEADRIRDTMISLVAEKAVLELNGTDREALYRKCLEKAADGANIVPSEEDRDLLTQIASRLPGKKLTVSERNSGRIGEFLIDADGGETTVSVLSMIREILDKNKDGIRAILFPEKK